MTHQPMEWVALGLLIGMGVFLIYLLIFIHDIPYQVAKKRGHPQKDAILAGCWLSLLMLHAMWPILFIWALARSGPIAPGDGQGKQITAI
jgi:hypothetical protein